MKKLNHHEHLPLTVSASFDNFQLLESIIEKLSYRKPASNMPSLPASLGIEAIDTSCVEAYVSGSFLLSEKEVYTCSSFTSCFLFTCIREKNGVDSLAWSSSLS
jgi:hypothetical protein